MSLLINDETCSKRIPKALAQYGHDWPVDNIWGVLIGVARCRNCNTVAEPRHFPAANKASEPGK